MTTQRERVSIALSARGVLTNGLHSRGNTAHMNLSRSMADVWAIPPETPAETMKRIRQSDLSHRSQAWGKMPYAGKEVRRVGGTNE